MRRALSNLILSACVLAGCSRNAPVTPNPVTPSKFTEEFAEALRRAAPHLKVEIVRDLQLKVTAEDGHEFTSFLDNAYDTYKQDPGDKDAVIQRFVAATVQMPTGTRGPVDKTRIVPVVKDRAWIEETRQALIQRGAEKLPQYAYEDLNDELIVLYAEDLPTSIQYLKPEDLDQAKVRKEDLRSLACDNLKKLLPKIERHGSDGLYMLTAGGHYESSLLLLDSIWSGDDMKVNGEIVVAIPTRDLLLVTGSNDTEGLRKVRTMVKESTQQGPYRLTPKLFVYREGRFVVFDE